MNQVCECGHDADTHTPCCVSACGCDGFVPKRLTDADVDGILAKLDDSRFNTPEWRARMWEKFQKKLREIDAA